MLLPLIHYRVLRSPSQQDIWSRISARRVIRSPLAVCCASADQHRQFCGVHFSSQLRIASFNTSTRSRLISLLPGCISFACASLNAHTGAGGGCCFAARVFLPPARQWFRAVERCLLASEAKCDQYSGLFLIEALYHVLLIYRQGRVIFNSLQVYENIPSASTTPLTTCPDIMRTRAFCAMRSIVQRLTFCVGAKTHHRWRDHVDTLSCFYPPCPAKVG